MDICQKEVFVVFQFGSLHSSGSLEAVEVGLCELHLVQGPWLRKFKTKGLLNKIVKTEICPLIVLKSQMLNPISCT